MEQQTNSTEELFRSETDRMIAGVAGGLATYFQLDSSIMRLIILLFAFAGGSGILAYLILWLVIPTESNLNSPSEKVYKENIREIKSKAKEVISEIKKEEGVGLSPDLKSDLFQLRRWIGLIVFSLGLIWLLPRIEGFSLGVFWPIILIIVGLIMLV
ncbi:MAG: PspC domain-containing protein [Candidatus Pacebacteria bacterium]|nr:PspC domain-containing protein [Candidatus Paceibacterota bacterium]